MKNVLIYLKICEVQLSLMKQKNFKKILFTFKYILQYLVFKGENSKIEYDQTTYHTTCLFMTD